MEFFQHGGVFKRLMQFAQTIYFPLVHHKIEFPPSSGKKRLFPDGRSAYEKMQTTSLIKIQPFVLGT